MRKKKIPSVFTIRRLERETQILENADFAVDGVDGEFTDLVRLPPYPPPKRVKVTVEVDKGDYEELVKMSNYVGETLTQLLQGMVKNYLESFERKEE